MSDGGNDRIKNVLIPAASFKILFLLTGNIGSCSLDKLQRRLSAMRAGRGLSF
jgi:hypothetical protein